MNGKGIYTNIEGTKSLGNEMINQAESYNSEITKLYNNIEELKSGWTGEDNQSYVAQVESYRETLTSLGEIINQYGTFLIKAAASFEKTRSDIASAAKNL